MIHITVLYTLPKRHESLIIKTYPIHYENNLAVYACGTNQEHEESIIKGLLDESIPSQTRAETMLNCLWVPGS